MKKEIINPPIAFISGVNVRGRVAVYYVWNCLAMLRNSRKYDRKKETFQSEIYARVHILIPIIHE